MNDRQITEALRVQNHAIKTLKADCNNLVTAIRMRDTTIAQLARKCMILHGVLARPTHHAANRISELGPIW